MTSTPTTPLPVHDSNVTTRRRYANRLEPSGREQTDVSDVELASPPRKRVRELTRNGKDPTGDPVDSGPVQAIADRPANQSTNSIFNEARPLNTVNTTATNLPSPLPMLLVSSCPIPSTALKFASLAKRKPTTKLMTKTLSKPSDFPSGVQCFTNEVQLDGFEVPSSANELPARNLRPQSKSPQKRVQPRLFPTAGSLSVSSKGVSLSNSTASATANSADCSKLPKQSTVRRLKTPRPTARLNVSLSWKAGASHNFHSDESTPPTAKPNNIEMTTSTSRSSSSAVSTKLRPPTRSQRRRVSFGRLQVYYFDRAQGFDTMPAAGSVALGMEQRHHTMKEYSFFEFNKVSGLEQTQKCARWLAAANAEIRQRSAAGSRASSRLASPGPAAPRSSSSAESSMSTVAGRLNVDFATALAFAGVTSSTKHGFPSIGHVISDDSSSLASVDEEGDCLVTATSSSNISEPALANDASITDALNNNNPDDDAMAAKQDGMTDETTGSGGTAKLDGTASGSLAKSAHETKAVSPAAQSADGTAADAENPTVASAIGLDAANFFAYLQDRLKSDQADQKQIANDDNGDGEVDQPAKRDIPNLDETISYRPAADGGSASSAGDDGFVLPSFLAGLSAAGIKFNVAQMDDDDNEDIEDVADSPPRSPTSSTYSSDEDVTDEFKQLEGQFFPIRSRIRRTILRQSGVDIDTSIRDEYLEIVRSRSDVGCDCVGLCQSATCACIRLGVGCQVDRPPFPCACDVSCTNPEGRVEYDPVRVHTHYLHTIMRLKTIQKRDLEGSPLSVSPQRIKFTDNDNDSSGGKGPSPLTGPAPGEGESSDA